MYNQPPPVLKSNNKIATNLLLKKYQKQLKTKLYLQKVYYCFLAILIFLSIYLIYNAPPIIPASKLFLALLIFWVCLFPGLHYLKDSNRPPIPFLPLIGIFYAITFSLPIFLSDEADIFGTASLKEVTHFSLSLTLIGVLSLIYFFYQAKSLIWKNIKPIQISKSFSVNRLLTLLWFLLIAHLVYMYFPVLHSIPSIGSFLGRVGILCYGIFYLIWAEGKLSSIQAFLLTFVFFPLDLLPAFASGAVAQVLLLAIFMNSVMWYKHQRIPVLLITLTVLFYIIFNPIKGEYRSLVWFGDHRNENLIEKAQLFTDLAIKHQMGQETTITEEEANTSNISRIAHIALFSKVIEDTPKIVPYWNGETYLSLFTKFIPRIVWKDKPTETVGNQFGQRYHLISVFNTNTSVNLPWLVELYANFGVLGVLIGMPFFGVLLALIEQLFNNNQMNLIEVVLGITVTFNLAYQESNFSLMIGNVLLLTVAFYLLFKFTVASRA